MPELPEVEIVRQSLDKKIKQKSIKKVIIRNKNLRFPLPKNFSSFLMNKKKKNVISAILLVLFMIFLFALTFYNIGIYNREI